MARGDRDIPWEPVTPETPRAKPNCAVFCDLGTLKDDSLKSDSKTVAALASSCHGHARRIQYRLLKFRKAITVCFSVKSPA